MKSPLPLFLALCFAAFGLHAQNAGIHNTSTEPSVTQAAQQHEFAKSFTLSGSEHAIVNGVYSLNGLNRLGQPRYTHSSGDYDLNYDGNGNWWLNTDKNLSGGTQYYRAAGNSNDPPLANWLDDKGQQTTLTLVADPGNAAFDAQKNAPKPVVNYISREGTDDIDPNQVIEVKHVPATQILNGGTTTISRGANAENGFPANGYIYNLRIGWYRINDDGGNCDFSGESPDPRYIVNTSAGLSFSQTINPGDDKNCGWQRMDNDGRYMLPGDYEVTSSASPFQFTMGIMAWEEDNCGDENTYNDDCTFNDDDHPASTSTTVTLDPSMMNLGYNSMDINWSGNGAQYGLRLEWELLPTLKIVTLYSDANLSGRTQHFGEGSYDVNTLFTGVGNDNITSMLIPAGYKVIAFNNSNYVGYPIEFRGTVNNVGGPNKTISSFQVVADNTPPNTDKTLLIYFNGSGKSLEYQLQRFAPEVNADQMIFIKGIGGDTKDYTNYNQQGLQHREEEVINAYVGFEGLLPPIPTIFYSTAKVFKNDNNGGGFDRYFFGVDMDYDGSAGPGYEDEDSYTAAANVLRVLRRYNLKGYSRIVISGHSRGAAVGIASLLYGIKKAVENDVKFAEFQGVIDDVFGSATTINVLALDPVAGSTTIGFRNDYHMGSTWRAREIYQWLKGRYTNINFSEIYANGGRMLDAEDIGGFGFLFPNNTFDPSPNYLHEEPSNNVQRYWLGYRHSSMINKTEKWTYIYDAEGIQRPWLLTSAMLNAGLQDQTLFRNHQHWYDAFHENDQKAWLQALEQDGCTESASAQVGLNPLAVPDSDLEFQHYHGTRHTTFNNSDDSPVNMDDFVGNNNIKFHCSDEYKIPANADLYEASNSYTENDGWTHYCTCQGKRLLSLKLGGTGADVPTNGVSFKEANNSYYVPAGSGFIANPGGAVMMGRSWNVNPTTQPNSPVGVRYYFRHSDVENINATFTMRNEPPVSDVTRLFLYKATSGAAHANVADIPTANILKNGFTPSIDTWVYGLTLRGDFSAEYQVASFSGGGAGGISCTTPTASIAVTNNCGGAFLDLTSDAATYRWSNGATTADITVTTPGTYTVIVTSEFGGCTATATAMATGDSQAPSITCPANIAVANTTNLCSAIASYSTPVGTDNCPNPTTIQTLGLPSGASFPVGATTNIFKVTDASGNTATCAFAVSVTDIQLPLITCPANIQVANVAELCSAVVSYTTPVGTDNCSSPSTIQTAGLPSGASYPVGATTNVFKVTDGTGNTRTCVFSVTVFDTQLPTISCPANIAVANTTGQCSATVTYTTPVGMDNCSSPSTIQTAGLPSGASYPVGATTNVFKVTDGTGNTRTCVFSVTVFDTQLPTISCPANMAVANTTGQCGAVATYTTPVGTDNCPNPNTLQTAGLPSGGTFPVGLTTNSFRVTDGASNSTTCAFTVTVTDTQAPSITCPANKTANAINSPVCTTVVNGIDAVFSDNCSAVLSYARSGITTGSGSGSASGQVFNKGLTTVTYTATDGPGNSVTCSFAVTVTCEIVFTGRIIWKQDNTSGVKDVTVALSGDQTASIVTPLNGNYAITVPPGANFMLTPTKTLNKFNGVNAQDVFRIQQHLSGNLLTDPYLLVAADVNSNNVVSSLDANIIQLSMLGNTQAAAQFINSWRFVPTTHVMTNPPWGFPEKITFTGIAENQSGKDFYGIKVGDVAALYGNPANLAPEPPFVLTTNDEVLQAGNELEVNMQASQTEDLTAMQFGLHFDPQRLELTAIESQSALPLSEDNFGLYEKDLGRINFLWAGTESMNVPESAPVFRLKFKVLASGGKLSGALQLTDETLPALAFKGNNAEAEVLLHYFGTTGVSGTNNPRLQLLQNQPNPFTSRTLIGFELPEACAAQLRIMDASGRVIAVRTKQYPAGLHSEVFELEGVSGVLYYELTTPFGVLSKKMVVIKG